MNYKRLAISLVLPQLAGLVGSIFTVSAIPVWYAALRRPSFNPPNWIFGPTWFLLYILMGISIYLIWQKIAENKNLPAGAETLAKAKGAARLFWIHLFFNAIWSIIFFGFQNTGLAFLDIIIIWIFILVLMMKFWKIEKWSTYLLIPYFLWVSFASALNYFIWYLN